MIETIPILGALGSRVAVDSNGCWVHQGPSSNGYGSVCVLGRKVYLHRLTYEMFIGELVPGLHVDHLCRNRACCNPAHLEQVTPRVNTERSPFFAGRRTVCHAGHEYTEATIKPEPTKYGGMTRRCRECRRIAQRNRRAVARSARTMEKWQAIDFPCGVHLVHSVWD